MGIINIHDSRVSKYVVDFENKQITLTTKTEGNELIEIIFKDVIAYFFDDTIMGFCFSEIKKMLETIKPN